MTIREIGDAIASVVGRNRRNVLETRKPRRHCEKLRVVSEFVARGWTARIDLRKGLERTVAWYRDHISALRR